MHTLPTLKRPAAAAASPSTAEASAWRFDHINVLMGENHALRTLFEGVMELQPGFRPPFPFPGLWLYAGDQAVVHAVNDANLSTESGELRFGHIAFRSDQPAAPLIEKLRVTGLPFRISRVPEDAIAQIFVLLPGNFVVELNVPDEGVLPEDHIYSASQAAPGGQNF